MKWFKHYTNAHKGSVIQSLIPVFGKIRSHGLYFLLVEYLSDKWDGSGEPRFKIAKSELRSFLTLKQNKLSSFLVCMKNETDFSFEETENFYEIFFPKLLEIRHRDALNASIRLETCGRRSGVEKNKKKKNTLREWVEPAFNLLVDRYQKTFPGTEIGRDALKRYGAHATDEATAEAISLAVAHYAAHLKSLTWERAPKQSIATFLGPIKSPFWSEYRTPKNNGGGDSFSGVAS